MELALLFFFFCFVGSLQGADEFINCDQFGIAYYETLGCKVVRYQKNGCPSEYKCDNLKYYGDKCYYRGNIYNDGDKIDEREGKHLPHCYHDCYCKIVDGEPTIDCEIEGRSECGNRTEAGQPVLCTYHGVRYKIAGEKITQYETCRECFCREGFEGKLEAPFCEYYDPDIYTAQIEYQKEIQKFCAPQYMLDDVMKIPCRPIVMSCSTGDEVITNNVSADLIDIDGVGECKYGNLTLRVGQFIHEGNSDCSEESVSYEKRCECVISPLLTCVWQDIVPEC